MRKKITIKTLGCKLNFAESSYLSTLFEKEGGTIVATPQEADLFVLHSCTLTTTAERKCRAAIRKAKKENPAIQIAVIGCYAESGKERLLAMEEVDMVLGNANKYDITNLISEEQPHTQFHAITNEASFLPAFSGDDRTRLFLKIQDGCNYFCSYCIIPYTRGRSRSTTIPNTIALAKEGLKKGAKEIILTGINIGEYGKTHGSNLFMLLQELEQVEALQRLRISSIEPQLLTDEIIDFAATSRIIQPHFHLPLQGGTNALLKAMNRKYSVEFYKKKVEKIRSVMPYACIAADVIVGFPGETEEMFEETLAFIQSLQLSALHVFAYSEREGTKAVLLPNAVPIHIRKTRSRTLQHLSKSLSSKFYEENREKKFKILLEKRQKDGYLHGWTSNYIPVKTKNSNYQENSIHSVTLQHFDKENLIYTV